LTEALERLKKRLPRNNQRGFTLIELLVVISILGILAAVVTMSMVGVTKLAQQRAADAEKATVQAAIDTMANEQLVPADAVCVGSPTTSNMKQFPSSDVPSDAPAGHATALAPRYLRSETTHGTYSCDNTGKVTQVDYKP
jgi:prepilin-type N-terminal cleavage/methylation domain-containing protein